MKEIKKLLRVVTIAFVLFTLLLVVFKATKDYLFTLSLVFKGVILFFLFRFIDWIWSDEE